MDGKTENRAVFSFSPIICFCPYFSFCPHIITSNALHTVCWCKHLMLVLMVEETVTLLHGFVEGSHSPPHSEGLSFSTLGQFDWRKFTFCFFFFDFSGLCQLFTFLLSQPIVVRVERHAGKHRVSGFNTFFCRGAWSSYLTLGTQIPHSRSGSIASGCREGMQVRPWEGCLVPA